MKKTLMGIIFTSAVVASSLGVASAFESLPIEVLPLEVEPAQKNGHSVDHELARAATKMLKFDLKKVPAFDLQNLEKDIQSNDPKPGDIKVTQADLVSAPVTTAVCVIGGNLQVDKTGKDDDSNASRQITGARLDLKVIDFNTHEVLEHITASAKPAAAVALPDVKDLHKADFNKSPVGQLLQDAVTQAVAQFETKAKDSTTKLSVFAAKAAQSKSSKKTTVD